jgi:hypothetical protein
MSCRFSGSRPPAAEVDAKLEEDTDVGKSRENMEVQKNMSSWYDHAFHSVHLDNQGMSSNAKAAPMQFGERITELKLSTRPLDILFLTNAHNSMSQRAWLELTALGHKVTVELALSRDQMVQTAEKYKPELIVAPFLTKFVDEQIYRKWPTLIVHPGIHGDRGASSIDWALSKGLEEWGVTVLNAAEVIDGGDIWSSVNYPIKRDVHSGVITKSSMYGNEAFNAAMVALKEALHQYLGDIPPTPLDYSDPACKGGSPAQHGAGGPCCGLDALCTQGGAAHQLC